MRPYVRTDHEKTARCRKQGTATYYILTRGENSRIITSEREFSNFGGAKKHGEYFYRSGTVSRIIPCLLRE